jgi:hypothetical protein
MATGFHLYHARAEIHVRWSPEKPGGRGGRAAKKVSHKAFSGLYVCHVTASNATVMLTVSELN